MSNNTKKEKKKEMKSDTTSLSVINTQELNNLIEENLGNKESNNFLVNGFMIFVLIVSLVSFFICVLNKNTSIFSLIMSLLLTIYTILFVTMSMRGNKNKSLVLISGLLLFVYSVLNSFSYFKPFLNNKGLEDFRGKSLTYVVKWAKDNKVNLTQEYEYSDMVSEYKILSQSIKSGTNLDKVKDLVVSISEGPNPYKEIMVPSMTGWDTERVISFVNDNYMSNVSVEFIVSDMKKDTVVEQSASGSMKRNDELKLTFSWGEEKDTSELTLIDFTNKSKFEVELYMKQHSLRYEFVEDFSKDIKINHAMSQSIKAGELVHPDDEKITVTISKGPAIKIPDVSKYDVEKITEWAIKNKIKIHFVDEYDDTVKANNIIKFDYNKNDVVMQGTVIKVFVSKGSLKMPKFKDLNSFYEWANKYGIKYEEEHEFSDTVKAGEVISYSYKNGDAIKNGDTIIVKISDGVKKTVPNVIGLSKNEAIKKLNNASLNYNFVYRNSNEAKDIVIGQSLSANSEVSSGATITVTLSNGKKPEKNTNNNTNYNNNSNNNNSSSNNNSGSSTTPVQPRQEDTTPEVVCTPCTIGGLRSVYTNPDNQNSFDKMAAALRAKITSQCPGIKVNILGDSTSTLRPGEPVSGFSGGTTDSCQTVTITIAQ